METKDKVKLANGSEAEVIIKAIGYTSRNNVFKMAVKTGMTGGAASGSFDMFELQNAACRKFVVGVVPNSISWDEGSPIEVLYSEGDRLFEKYFMEAFNMGDNSKNSKQTSEK
jgi:hypothetical protein